MPSTNPFRQLDAAPDLTPPTRHPWMERALCTQVDPALFFPDGNASHHTKVAQQAVAVCRSCDVRAECLEYALAHDERFGVWGGHTESERARMRRTA